MNFSEVNFALNKPAYQHSTYVRASGIVLGADLAVDGNPDPDLRQVSCSHTKWGHPPWWMVDLGEEVLATSVKIKRQTLCPLHNAKCVS